MRVLVQKQSKWFSAHSIKHQQSGILKYTYRMLSHSFLTHSADARCHQTNQDVLGNSCVPVKMVGKK